jgi:hypothetical protein
VQKLVRGHRRFVEHDCILDPEEEELDATLQRADAALYLAKRPDGNRVVG